MNRRLVYDFKEKYSKLSKKELEKLKKELIQLKEYSLGKLDILIDDAVNAFEDNGIHVHQTDKYTEAGEILQNLINDRKFIVKSKSNVINNIKLKDYLKNTEIIETDLGDFVTQITGLHDCHPVLPALSISAEEISKSIKKKYGEDVEADPKSIAAWARNYLRNKIKDSEIGLTGANVLTTQGEIVLLENEGNISLLSRLPDVHIVVATVEKIVENSSDALKITQALGYWGTGQKRTSYVSFISGPSKTADIENKVVIGAQGAKEVHLILIDDREKFIKAGLEDILKCINCGACLSMCPAYHISDRSDQYIGIKSMAMRYLEGELDQKVPYLCTTCGMCTQICPVGINLREILLKLRAEVGQSEANKKMIKKIEQFGNPFGEKPEEVEELYCC